MKWVNSLFLCKLLEIYYFEIRMKLFNHPPLFSLKIKRKIRIHVFHHLKYILMYCKFLLILFLETLSRIGVLTFSQRLIQKFTYVVFCAIWYHLYVNESVIINRQCKKHRECKLNLHFLY